MNDAAMIARLFHGESAAEILPLQMIEPSEENPRRTRDAARLQELADSIGKVGCSSPSWSGPRA